MLKHCILLAVFSHSLIATIAGAAVLEFTNKSPWESAAGPYRTADFTGFPIGTLITNQYSHLGVLFTDGADFVTLNNSCPNDGWGLRGAPDTITVEFDSPQYSIAVEHPGSVRFELYSGGSLIYLSSYFTHSGVGFFSGLVSTLPFDKARIFDLDGGVLIDDLHFGAVPAPGALALLAAAALTCSGRRRIIASNLSFRPR